MQRTSMGAVLQTTSSLIRLETSTGIKTGCFFGFWKINPEFPIPVFHDTIKIKLGFMF
ncbi:hypothetical protein [Aquimarina macrocephali]|uniref:hypothetical protein n=1 Tax=Aquimarina macrocephali TaxID=666563 RepID=UPI001376ECA3|nr:hypothetical protein [Aquimarina macrocephali]